MKKQRIPTPRVYGEQCGHTGICYDETFGEREISSDTYKMTKKEAKKIIKEFNKPFNKISIYKIRTALAVLRYFDSSKN